MKTKKKSKMQPITYEEVTKLSNKISKKFYRTIPGKFDMRASIADEFTIKALLDLINQRLEKIYDKDK